MVTGVPIQTTSPTTTTAVLGRCQSSARAVLRCPHSFPGWFASRYVEVSDQLLQDAESERDIQREIRTHAHCEHPHIMPLLGHVIRPLRGKSATQFGGAAKEARVSQGLLGALPWSAPLGGSAVRGPSGGGFSGGHGWRKGSEPALPDASPPTAPGFAHAAPVRARCVWRSQACLLYPLYTEGSLWDMVEARIAALEAAAKKKKKKKGSANPFGTTRRTEPVRRRPSPGSCTHTGAGAVSRALQRWPARSHARAARAGARTGRSWESAGR